MTAKNEAINESVDNVCTQRSQLFVIHERKRRISGEKSLENEEYTFTMNYLLLFSYHQQP